VHLKELCFAFKKYSPTKAHKATERIDRLKNKVAVVLMNIQSSKKKRRLFVLKKGFFLF